MIFTENKNKKIINYNNKLNNNKINNFETEIYKVKNLYEKQIITEEEYKKIRENIIQKYYE